MILIAQKFIYSGFLTVATDTALPGSQHVQLPNDNFVTFPVNKSEYIVVIYPLKATV